MMNRTSDRVRIGAVKAAVLLPALILLVGAFFGCWSFDRSSGGSPTEIKSGFSKELRAAYKEQYGIGIPDDAHFERGVYTNGFRDNYVVLLFTVPIDGDADPGDHYSGYLARRLGLEARREASAGDFETFEEYGGRMDWHYASDDYTGLSWSVVDGQTICVRFCGWRPERIFD